jgi:hypothetical protein
MEDCVGILLMKTKNFKEEYRVSYLNSFDELFYDDILCEITQDPIVILENARILFSDSKVLLSRELAYGVADELQNEKKTKNGIKLFSIPTTGLEF